MKILTMAVLAVALWKPTNAQLAAQSTKPASLQLSASADVKADGAAAVTLSETQNGKKWVLESSVLRLDGSLESETDSFYKSGNTLAGSMITRFDAQSRLVDYSIANNAGKTLSTTRVFAGISSKTPRLIHYLSKADNTDITYFLSDSGRVAKKEIERSQQKAQIVALYNERGVRREMSLQHNDVVTRIALRYNDRNKFSEVDFNGKESTQMTYAYDQSGHPTEIKIVSGKYIMRIAMTYNAQGKSLNTAVYSNENLQTHVSYSLRCARP